MKILLLVAIVYCLDLTKALIHDDIKGHMGKAESVVKCIIDSHKDLDDVEDLVERLETIAAGNGKIENLKKAVGGYLKSLGFELDDTRGFFGLAVDVYEGVKAAYEEGKDEEVLAFVGGLLQILPEGSMELVDKSLIEFMESENLGACAPAAEKRGYGTQKDMSALYSLLRLALNKGM